MGFPPKWTVAEMGQLEPAPLVKGDNLMPVGRCLQDDALEAAPPRFGAERVQNEPPHAPPPPRLRDRHADYFGDYGRSPHQRPRRHNLPFTRRHQKKAVGVAGGNIL